MKTILLAFLSLGFTFVAQAQQTDDKVYVVVEEFPEFPGGMKKLHEFLSDNIKYPDAKIEQGENGKVLVKFVVSDTGVLSNIEIKRGIPNCPECDKEALRLVSIMPNWKPGKNNGKAVNTQYVLPISFVK